jgi:hypothetical protein
MCRCGGWLGRATLFELVSEVCGVHVSKLSKRGARSWRFGKLLLGSKRREGVERGVPLQMKVIMAWNFSLFTKSTSSG